MTGDDVDGLDGDRASDPSGAGGVDLHPDVGEHADQSIVGRFVDLDLHLLGDPGEDLRLEQAGAVVGQHLDLGLIFLAARHADVAERLREAGPDVDGPDDLVVADGLERLRAGVEHDPLDLSVIAGPKAVDHVGAAVDGVAGHVDRCVLVDDADLQALEVADGVQEPAQVAERHDRAQQAGEQDASPPKRLAEQRCGSLHRRERRPRPHVACRIMSGAHVQ